MRKGTTLYFLNVGLRPIRHPGWYVDKNSACHIWNWKFSEIFTWVDMKGGYREVWKEIRKGIYGGCTLLLEIFAWAIVAVALLSMVAHLLVSVFGE